MATRGNVGYADEEGKIHFIYNHFDSTPNTLGAELLENYNSYEKVVELINGGDMSYPGDHYADGDACYEDVAPRTTEDALDVLEEEYAYIYMNDGWFWMKTGMEYYLPLVRE